MRNQLLVLIFTTLTSWYVFTSPCQAQMITTEEKFQDLFVTAGYGTAFGAAFGAALLSFQSKPEQNLRFIAIGASVGFISGSLLGSYVVFSPLFSNNSDKNNLQNTIQANLQPGLKIIPDFDLGQNNRLASLEAQWTILHF